MWDACRLGQSSGNSGPPICCSPCGRQNDGWGRAPLGGPRSAYWPSYHTDVGGDQSEMAELVDDENLLQRRSDTRRSCYQKSEKERTDSDMLIMIRKGVNSKTALGKWQYPCFQVFLACNNPDWHIHTSLPLTGREKPCHLSQPVRHSCSCSWHEKAGLSGYKSWDYRAKLLIGNNSNKMIRKNPSNTEFGDLKKGSFITLWDRAKGKSFEECGLGMWVLLYYIVSFRLYYKPYACRYSGRKRFLNK